MRDPHLLGTVALAGASDLEEVLDAIVSAKQPVLNGLLAFGVFGFKTVYPKLALQDILTDQALAHYDASVADGCRAASGAFTALSPEEMFKPGWRDNQYVKQFLARNQPGSQSVHTPVFLVSGGTDSIFTAPAGRKIFQRLCAAGGQIQRKVYPGLGHDAVVYGSLKDQMDWVAARFAGEPAPSNCPSQ